ncbi:MAG: 16S rRNA (uracil(1498)-N(3))-methyltransferase, partial [Acidimicrobiales bacterium]
GFTRLFFLTTDCFFVRWAPLVPHPNVARLREVARQAAMQSRRMHLPEVTGLHSFLELAGSPESAGDADCIGRVALAEPGGVAPSLRFPVALVGPEGGWSEAELGNGLPTVGLGATVLRSESAAVALGVLLGALRGGLVGPR